MSTPESTNYLLSFESVIERAKEELRCDTDKALAERMGISPQTLNNRKKTKSIPYDELIAAALTMGCDIAYILTNKRKMDFVADGQNHYALQTDFIEIPHYNVQAAAGAGKVANNEVTLKPLAFRQDWLAKRHLKAGNLAIVGVSGDSMEDHLRDGDLVLVDMSQKDITNGKTYVLRIDGHLLVKNLQMLPHGVVQVASFNPGFPPYTVDLSDESIDISVIGRVVASTHEW